MEKSMRDSSRDTRLHALGVRIPDIMLPSPAVDRSLWAVIACDQHTSDRSYWNSVEKRVGNAPSSLKLIYPEVYLEDADKNKRIAAIHETMNRYLEDGVLETHPKTLVYLERDTGRTHTRKGLLFAFDLEQYDYTDGSRSLIRATEGTILERLPPRMEIRRRAPLELPHILVLIDDPDHQVIAPLTQKTDRMRPLYSTELMCGGGRIDGYAVEDSAVLDRVLAGLESLADPSTARQRYNTDDVLLFAMGDGNHSLATAKAVWDETRREAGGRDNNPDHPARWALAELVNLHDPGLVMEPIHRLVTGLRVSDFLRELGRYKECSLTDNPDGAPVEVVSGKGKKFVTMPSDRLAVAVIEDFLDMYRKKYPETNIDYVHGIDVVRKSCAEDKTVGIILPKPDRTGLFQTVISEGALPRKTFSLGEPHEKRYYMEARRIR
jgi:hypothetical protein